MKFRVLSLSCFFLFASTQVFAEELLAQIYPIENVRKIVVGGGAHIEIRQGNSESLRAEATQDVLERVSVDLSGDRLTLKVKHARMGFFDWFNGNDEQIKFVVEVKELSDLELGGAAQASIGELRGSGLKLDLHGASRAEIDQLDFDVVKVNLSGAGHIRVTSLTAQQLYAEVSGAAQMAIDGSGTLDEAHLEVSGASKYFAKGLTTTDAWVHASGASHMEIRVTETLDANASGASSINYFGNPRVKHDSSGASRIHSQGE